ncbi:hypothetical protein HZ993_21965 [Rhodoferax sp. AJA081-3]|uniref:hypothetical protein n=1 Tax=Rhodoferax sp. AJA081-3 TaxID=2752316 RepID=UPI001AE0B7FF|nr:hypothetical protein [Rhodoferax sp. AJA081-3]QTN27889.1 hypothetical protein HZ993_21965 [Rhodoferax sp. AJA081-3]
MELSVDNPQILILAGLALLLLVALLVRQFGHRKNPRTPRSRFGEDHSQAITEMGNRTRQDAQRKERERLAETTPNLGH